MLSSPNPLHKTLVVVVLQQQLLSWSVVLEPPLSTIRPPPELWLAARIKPRNWFFNALGNIAAASEMEDIPKTVSFFVSS